MRETIKRTGFLAVSLAILYTVVQLAIYRQYAFEVIWLQAKSAIGKMTFEDQRKWGAICNSLGLRDCSVKVFKSLVSEMPGNTVILSNLAVALALQNNFAEAEPYFKAYFADGGHGLDVMYWYGKTLRALNRDEEALPWFYQVLYHQAGDSAAAKELFDILQQMGRLYEAQNLLVSLIAQTPDLHEKAKWQIQLEKLQNQSRPMADRHPAGYTVPSLDGKHFYLPVIDSQGHLSFLQSSENELETQLNREDIKRLGLKMQMLGEDKALISRLNIGSITATNFEVRLCERCESRLGEKLLAAFAVRIEGRGKMPYLIMSGEENK